MIGGYDTFHWFPIGTVVEVIEQVREGVWNCRSIEFSFSQAIETKDLVVVE